MSQCLIEFIDIHYTYPGSSQPALNGLNLCIPAHTKTALIGQNGCGKTTLFLLANGLFKPQRGKVYYQGQPLVYNRRPLMELRQKVGLVFQNPEQQIVASTVEEDISYGLCNLGLPDKEITQRVEQALSEFGLTEFAGKPVHHLSLGQKKRVSLADVMVLQPELLLLDEPTAFLDQLYTRQLMATLKKIDAGGTTILMATHDLNLVYRWADWIIVLDQGRLVLEGKPKDVFSQREILEELHLGVPLIFDLVSQVSEFIESDLTNTPLLIERLRSLFL
ncbi:MAG: ABC transporter ATP-binding protein [Nostocaceae cyanobacterium]|nr:ABC transporter ATP-binding protein [Nostocaceae cyanobacterium]